MHCVKFCDRTPICSIQNDGTTRHPQHKCGATHDRIHAIGDRLRLTPQSQTPMPNSKPSAALAYPILVARVPPVLSPDVDVWRVHARSTLGPLALLHEAATQWTRVEWAAGQGDRAARHDWRRAGLAVHPPRAHWPRRQRPPLPPLFAGRLRWTRRRDQPCPRNCAGHPGQAPARAEEMQ